MPVNRLALDTGLLPTAGDNVVHNVENPGPQMNSTFIDHRRDDMRL